MTIIEHSTQTLSKRHSVFARKNRRRRGFTLIEVVCTLAAVSIVTSMGAVLICLILDSHSKQRKLELYQSGQQRLLTQFRREVKQFGMPEIVDSNKTGDNRNIFLRWKTPERLLVYQTESTPTGIRVWRVLRETTKQKVQESYMLSDRTQIELYTQTLRGCRFVALSLWVSPPNFPIVAKNDLNPFTGELAKTISDQIDPRYTLNWNYAISKIPDKDEKNHAKQETSSGAKMVENNPVTTPAQTKSIQTKQ